MPPPPPAPAHAPTAVPPGAFRAARRLPFRELVFMSSWYRSPSPARDPELRLCFWLNSHCAAFTRRIWFVDRADAAAARAAAERGEIAGDIEVLPEAARGRLRYGDAFRLARRRFPADAVLLLANSDIAVPAASASLLAALAALPRTAVCLTRHECDLPPAAARRLAAQLPRLAGPDAWAAVARHTHLVDPRRGSRSQDVWVWHASLRPSLARLDAIPLGKPGCDNALAHHLAHDAKARLLNPCLAARTYHLHSSAVRHYTARDRIPPPYAGVPFTLLPGDPGHAATAAAAAAKPNALPARTPASGLAAATSAPPPRRSSAATTVFVPRRLSPLHASPATRGSRVSATARRAAVGPVFLGYV
jgi:hypothetical protein